MIGLLAALIISSAFSMHIERRACDIEHSQYDAPGPRYDLRFVKLASAKGLANDVGLHLYSSDPKAEVWYFIDEGSAPRVSLISTASQQLAAGMPILTGEVRPMDEQLSNAMNQDEIDSRDASRLTLSSASW